MAETNPAPATHPVTLPGEIWGITAYFNPAEYANKKSHLRLFSDRVRHQGLKLLIVECAFGTSPHVLEDQLADRIVRVRSSSVLWQKERLLNLAAQNLPDSCDKVVWLDADVLLANDHWVADLSQALERYVVVQLFERSWWLSPEATAALPSNLCHLPQEIFSQWQLDSPRTTPSVAYAQVHNLYRNSTEFFDTTYGHNGFAWAARRTFFNSCGLYDRCILGSGDSMLAWAISGYFEASFLKNAVAEKDAPKTSDATMKGQRFLRCRKIMSERYTPAQRSDIKQWAERAYREAAGSVSFLPGGLYHLWHGDRTNRKYVSRLQVLKDGGFDPQTDISLNPDGCWQWNTDKPEMHQQVQQYFRDRDEESIGTVNLALK